MSALSLEIRNMETEEQGVAEFADVEAAMEWLKERPHLIEVLRPVQRDLDPALEASLRQAMRPLDPTERARRDELDQARDDARRARLQAMNRQAVAEAHPISGGAASSLVLHWERGRGLWVDGDENAEIADDVAGAALEWIRERDRWVHARRQHVGSATLTVVLGDGGGGDLGLARGAAQIADTSEFSTLPGFSDHEIM